MNLTGIEYKLYLDFKQAIREGIAEYGLQAPHGLVLQVMKRVDQNTEQLYEEWGVNDTEFVNCLQKIIKETMLLKGYGGFIYR